MPVLIEGLQEVAVLDLPVAAGTAFWLRVRLDGKHLYTCEEKVRRQDLVLFVQIVFFFKSDTFRLQLVVFSRALWSKSEMFRQRTKLQT